METRAALARLEKEGIEKRLINTLAEYTDKIYCNKIHKEIRYIKKAPQFQSARAFTEAIYSFSSCSQTVLKISLETLD